MSNSLLRATSRHTRPLFVRLAPSERAALTDHAERERRDPRDQAALLIRAQLERLGLLNPSASQGVVPCPGE